MATNGERKRTRSPAYPYLDLEEAIFYTEKAYGEEDRHPFTPEAAADHWGYKVTSSAVSQIISALKQYGLLVEEPGSEVRRVRLSPLALNLMVHEEESDKDRHELLKTAALNPKIHREIWDKYGGKLPSDTSLRIYLIREREVPFNKDQVDKFISQFRETIEFAKLGPSDKMPDEGGTADSTMEKRESGERPGEQPRQLRRHTMQSAPGFQQATFPLNGGDASVQWPENITLAEFQDFQDWLELVIRKVKRSVKGDEPPGES
jgi:hypothetical protein